MFRRVRWATLLLVIAFSGVGLAEEPTKTAALGAVHWSDAYQRWRDIATNPYAAAKVSQEYYAAAFTHCFGVDTVSLRYFNVFGPRQDPLSEYAAVIPKFIALMLQGKRPTIYGDGHQSRDFTYIDNVVAGNLLAARAPGPLRGAVVNLACGDRISLLELTERLTV